MNELATVEVPNVDTTRPVSAEPTDSFVPTADPCLTANVYCTGQRDALILNAIAPGWRQFRHQHADSCGPGYLWLMRYARGGEHLKVRFHGPDELRQPMRTALSAWTTTFFESTPAEDASTGEQKAPAIDIEDEVVQDYRSHSLVWTKYRRSQLVFGSSPYWLDERYLALHTFCASRGTELIFSELEGRAPLAFRYRLGVLFQAILLALRASGMASGRRTAAYLLYHRDWMLRSLLRKTASRDLESERLLARLQQRVLSTPGTIEALAAALDLTNAPRGLSVRALGWLRSVEEAISYGEELREQDPRPVDPFASEPIFPILFKLLHGLANQLGLSRLNEAYAYQLLLHAADAADLAARPALLLPQEIVEILR